MNRRSILSLIPASILTAFGVGHPASADINSTLDEIDRLLAAKPTARELNERLIRECRHYINHRRLLVNPKADKPVIESASPLAEVIDAATALEREHNDPNHNATFRFKYYPEPKTTFDAWLFLVDHKARLTHQFDGVAGVDYINVTIGECFVNYRHECTKPRELDAYFTEYMLPAAIALHRYIYGHDINVECTG